VTIDSQKPEDDKSSEEDKSEKKEEGGFSIDPKVVPEPKKP